MARRASPFPHKATRLALALLPVLALPVSALADDGLARIENGVITFSKSRTITMRSEVLSISLQRIAADFVFVNEGDAPETVTVAFPVPEIDMATADGLMIPVGDQDDFFGFSTSVDGAPVAQALEQRAFRADGTDITEAIRRLGLPMFRPYWTTVDLLKALPEARQREAIAAGIAEGEPGDLAPAYRLRTTYHFTVTFPPGKPVSIRHQYRPSYDISNMSAMSAGARPDEATARAYCVSEADIAAVHAMEAAGPDGTARYATQALLDYVLMTARSWAGPIGSFHLIVETRDATTRLIGCLPLARTGPTRHEMMAKDFVPDADIRLMFVSPPPD